MDDYQLILRKLKKTENQQKDLSESKRSLEKKIMDLIDSKPDKETFRFILDHFTKLVMDPVIPNHRILTSFIAQEYESHNLDIEISNTEYYQRAFLQMLAQELILRNKELPSWKDKLYISGNPNNKGDYFGIIHLPIELKNFEKDLEVSILNKNGGRSSSLVKMSSERKVEDFENNELIQLHASDLEKDKLRMNITGPDRGYTWDHIIGKYIVKEPSSKISKQIKDKIIGLVSSKLGKIIKGEVDIFKTTLSNVAKCLFAVGNSGGAYGGAQLGATARARTWQTLQVLSGCKSVNSKDIEKYIKNCKWFFFSVDGWFHNVTWDFGVVCLRPDGTHFVFGGTDTD